MVLPTRPELAAAQRRAWQRIAGPGAWWTGAQRVAIAAETRAAAGCPVCERQRAALSPALITEAHVSSVAVEPENTQDSCESPQPAAGGLRAPTGLEYSGSSPGAVASHAAALPDAAIEVVHRVRSDSGRLTGRWYEQTLTPTFTDAHYVELVGIVATVMALDTHRIARGESLDPLPIPRDGEPSGHRPRNARRQIAWVPTLSPLDVEPGDPDPYPGKRPEHAVHIHQALSLVPEATAGFFDLDEAMYLPQAAIRDFGGGHRAIGHAQMELVAARLSALNGCEY